MELFERILTKEEINSRFMTAVTAIMVNKLISSKAGLAESLGVKPAKFSEILNGRMKVGVDMIAKMCDFYDVSPDWLLLSRGDHVFRQLIKPKIWIDDDDLNMDYPKEDQQELSSIIPEKDKCVPNPVIHSIEQNQSESLLYKMYQDEKEENKKLIREIGALEERLKQYEGTDKDDMGLLEELAARSVSIKKRSSGNNTDATSAGVRLE